MPSWFKNCILYQIFPDLFYKHNLDVNPPKGYYGGTIRGIIEKLEYIQSWGFDAVYINPIFKAGSSHRYDVIDFYQVDDVLGKMEDFEELVNVFHSRGIKIILDIPFNHVSQNHQWFKNAISGGEYSEYFVFEDGEYNRWRGSNLVELNLNNPKVLDKLIFSDDSVLKFWMRKGIDGVRLDCANDIGMKVSKLIRDEAHKINSEFLVMGEVFNYASEWSKVLDSLQSYYTTGLLYSLVKEEISLHSFSKGVDFLVDNIDYEVLLSSLNILSSHDTSRVLDVIDDLDVYKVLLAFQFMFPGVPSVLYGEEVGLKTGLYGEKSARKVMIWDESKWNKKVVQMYKDFISLRKSRKELKEGKFLNISSLADYDLFVFIRFTDRREEFSIVIINFSDKIVEKKIFIPYSHFHDALKVVDYFSGESFLCEISSIKVKLKPYQVMFLIPDWKYIKGYSFFKRY